MWWDERVSARFRRNLQPTLTYWSVFFSFGLCIAFLGPTLLDLRCQTQSSLSQITWVFFSQQFCLLLGSCLGGVFKRTLAQSLLALFASSLAISLVFAIIPLCHNVVVLAVVMAVAGLAMGCIDTISNMQLVKIYQKDSAIFLQALHFFVGFGALLSPLIADPFLSDTNCILANGTANASSNLPHIRKSLLPHHPGNLSHYALPMKGMVVTRVSYAFWIMALINVTVGIVPGGSGSCSQPHPQPLAGVAQHLPREEPAVPRPTGTAQGPAGRVRPQLWAPLCIQGCSSTACSHHHPHSPTPMGQQRSQGLSPSQPTPTTPWCLQFHRERLFFFIFFFPFSIFFF
uniref:Major facilitator superfamily domain containing 4A n=1 Tax=Junco hyemalis TaxID=40217 RepID=A0A8C5NHY1_JUNHY